MEEKPSKYEWVILIIFVVSAILIFMYRVNIPASDVSQLTTVLLSTFEILFSLYVGYFLQRLDSAKQSRENLKKYGFLAYRRIMDIKKSIDRLFSEIDKINKNYTKDKGSDIGILRSILEGTFDTVESSILDWVDIIGDEIRKKERADLLQLELAKSSQGIDLSAEDKKNIEQLKSELQRINSELPLSLKDKYGSEMEWIDYSVYFESSARRDGCVTLYIKPFIDISQENIERILSQQTFSFSFISERNESVGCFVREKDGNAIGTIENPLNSYGKKTYIQSLHTVFWFLDHNDQDRKATNYKFDNLKYIGVTNDKSMIIMQLPVEAGFAPWG